MGFDLGHLMKVRLTSLGNEDDDLNLLMRKRKGRTFLRKIFYFPTAEMIKTLLSTFERS